MRIFVTGIGAVTCVGAGVYALDAAMQRGMSGVAELGADFPALPADAVAGMVRTVRHDALPRSDAFLSAAIAEAFTVAGLQEAANLPVFLGSAHGHLDLWQREYRSGTPYTGGLWRMAKNLIEQHVGKADLTVVSTACTASSIAFGLALNGLRSGQSGIALVCGADSLTSFLHTGFASLRSLAKDQCRPFDRNRSGLVLGEGAAAILLETEAHAVQRAARPLAELAGFGFCADGVHLTAPDPIGAGASIAMRRACEEAKLTTAPGFINAHGTGTRLNDRMECLAIKRVFGSAVSQIPITSTKPVTGHMCGAAGAIEIVNTILNLQSGLVPPILGFNAPDKEFTDFDFVSDEARRGDFRTAISINSGFGGTNTALVLRQVTE